MRFAASKILTYLGGGVAGLAALSVLKDVLMPKPAIVLSFVQPGDVVVVWLNAVGAVPFPDPPPGGAIEVRVDATDPQTLRGWITASVPPAGLSTPLNLAQLHRFETPLPTQVGPISFSRSAVLGVIRNGKLVAS